MKNYTINKHMGKREFERFETRLQISLVYGNQVYSGTVTNLSESGMFITTKRRLPVDTMLSIRIPYLTSLIQVPVRIRRAVSPVNTRNAGESGVALNILRSSRDYRDFLGKYRSQQFKLIL